MKNPFYPFSVEVSGTTCLKSLDGIYYKRNIEYYQKFKKMLILLSILLSAVCVVVIILFDGWVQSLFATLLGGALSSIVWFISVIITDDMNYRINKIDDIISQIESLVSRLCTFNHYFVDNMDIIPVDSNNVCYRLCNLLQVITDLQIVKDIDSNDLKFKWIDGADICVQEFENYIEHTLSNMNEVLVKHDFKQLWNVVTYNEKYLSGQLTELKSVLLKRKGYILCGKAPIPQNKVADRINKANLFDKIFNHNQKGNKQ